MRHNSVVWTLQRHIATVPTLETGRHTDGLKSCRVPCSHCDVEWRDRRKWQPRPQCTTWQLGASVGYDVTGVRGVSQTPPEISDVSLRIREAHPLQDREVLQDSEERRVQCTVTQVVVLECARLHTAEQKGVFCVLLRCWTVTHCTWQRRIVCSVYFHTVLLCCDVTDHVKQKKWSVCVLSQCCCAELWHYTKQTNGVICVLSNKVAVLISTTLHKTEKKCVLCVLSYSVAVLECARLHVYVLQAGKRLPNNCTGRNKVNDWGVGKTVGKTMIREQRQSKHLHQNYQKTRIRTTTAKVQSNTILHTCAVTTIIANSHVIRKGRGIVERHTAGWRHTAQTSMVAGFHSDVILFTLVKLSLAHVGCAHDEKKDQEK